ncbi:MAG: class I SAM-dependent methyltransferase [Candidatus Hodarchaeota archaeon]
MNDKVDISLKDVSETLLIPLYCRARETESDNPIIKDPKAVEMIKALDYTMLNVRRSKLKGLIITLSIRSKIFDECVSSFLEQSPNAVVVNLGCGLDTRFLRLDNGTVEWYDLDLPDAITVRRHFFQETDRNHFISASVFDAEWIDTVAQKAIVLSCLLLRGS